MLGALALCACSSSDPQAPPIACPTAVLLDGADRTSAYRAGAERRPDNLRYMAALLNLASDCREVDEGIDVDLSFDVLAERGAAVSDTEELEYFVATVGPDDQILAKEVLRGDVTFAEDEQRAGWHEDLTLRLPSVTAGEAAGYRLYVGFQLDDAELERRRETLR